MNALRVQLQATTAILGITILQKANCASTRLISNCIFCVHSVNKKRGDLKCLHVNEKFRIGIQYSTGIPAWGSSILFFHREHRGLCV